MPESQFDQTKLSMLLKGALCSSCDGVALKFKNKNGWASSLQARIELA
jgi:hypothetical protein